MGQHNRLYFQSNLLGVNGINRAGESNMSEKCSQTTDGREGYRLIFDLPPRMNVVSNSNEQSKKSTVNANTKEGFYLKQMKRSSEVHNVIGTKLKGDGSLSVNRNPLNGFLREVLACVKPKV
ncbi:hypothetical protein AWW67_15990 [Roseivirga seohaensis]|uniref:Uncharacterized protein n=1 Tax=Roseivirga seohaensis TaxID=1914963 RepID=A0A150Y2L6_9BACT|nr:hypothetical protein [Roseivirga seohaensis]KYG85211.1 hypothetical protein AWW67_15990 [Roseivirga seohaensis]